MIKRSHVVEDLNSGLLILKNDLKYIHYKLNRGEALRNSDDLTVKELVSLIDRLLDERLHG